MGMAASLVMWPGPFEQTYVPPSQGGSIWNLASIGPEGFRGEDVWKCWDTNTQTYMRTTEPTYSGELIKGMKIKQTALNFQDFI